MLGRSHGRFDCRIRMSPASRPHPVPFSVVLESLGHGENPRLYVGEIVAAFGDRGFGAIMLLVSLINLIPLPPGGTTITGAPLLLLSMELAWGRESLWLPNFALSGSVSRSNFRRGVGRLLPLVRGAETLSRPRLAFLLSPLSQGFIGLACVFLCLVLVLPIPLGNVAPAATVAMFSLGVMQRDGLAVLLGWLGVAISAGLLVFAWRLIWAVAEIGVDWVGRIF